MSSAGGDMHYAKLFYSKENCMAGERMSILAPLYLLKSDFFMGTFIRKFSFNFFFFDEIFTVFFLSLSLDGESVGMSNLCCTLGSNIFLGAS